MKKTLSICLSIACGCAICSLASARDISHEKLGVPEFPQQRLLKDALSENGWQTAWQGEMLVAGNPGAPAAHPHPGPKPAPAAHPHPGPKPVPAAHPHPGPHPAPVAHPHPVPVPVPVPHPVPVPVPHPHPVPPPPPPIPVHYSGVVVVSQPTAVIVEQPVVVQQSTVVVEQPVATTGTTSVQTVQQTPQSQAQKAASHLPGLYSCVVLQANDCMSAADFQNIPDSARNTVMKAMLDFMDADEVIDDYRVSPGNLASVAFSKQKIGKGDVEYYTVMLKQPDAKKVIEDFSNAEKRDGHNVQTTEKGVVADNKIRMEEVGSNQLSIVEVDDIKDVPANGEKSSLANVWESQKEAFKRDTLLGIVCKDFSEEVQRKGAGKAPLVGTFLAIDMIPGASGVPEYNLYAVYSCADVNGVTGLLNQRMTKKLAKHGVSNLSQKFQIKPDSSKNMIEVTVQATQSEFVYIIDVLDLEND